MQLTVVVGAKVVGRIDAHSAINGAPIPSGAIVTLTSNDPAVATVPPRLDVKGQPTSLGFDVTVLAPGSTDITATVKTPDGSEFTDASSLIVTPVPVEGMTHISLTLADNPQVNPLK